MSNWRSGLSGAGKYTKTLIGINVLVFLAQLSSGNAVTSLLILYPPAVFSSPWTLLVSGFAHADWIHILLNMYSLWVFGDALEQILGSKRFLWLYLGSIVGGSLAFVILDPAGMAVGASGGIFGLMGAYFVVMRAMGYRSSQMLTLIGINVLIGFVNPGIAVSAHLGGLAAGAAIAWYFTKVRK